MYILYSVTYNYNNNINLKGIYSNLKLAKEDLIKCFNKDTKYLLDNSNLYINIDKYEFLKFNQINYKNHNYDENGYYINKIFINNLIKKDDILYRYLPYYLKL